MPKVNVKVLLQISSLVNYFLICIFWGPYKALRTKAIIPKKRIKRKYTKAFINKVKEEANTKTYDELIRKYNIPMGTIGYLLKKGKSSDNGNIVININRVIIRK